MTANTTSAFDPALSRLIALLPDVEALHPTLQTSVEAMVVAARAWLAAQDIAAQETNRFRRYKVAAARHCARDAQCRRSCWRSISSALSFSR
jgi:hypothetical protein